MNTPNETQEPNISLIKKDDEWTVSIETFNPTYKHAETWYIRGFKEKEEAEEYLRKNDISLLWRSRYRNINCADNDYNV